jgi:hypothetical protein
MGVGAAMVIADWVALVWLYRQPGCKLQCINIACSCYTVGVVCLTVGRSHTVFSVDPTDAPIDWLDSDHVICVYCRSMSVPQLYK